MQHAAAPVLDVLPAAHDRHPREAERHNGKRPEGGQAAGEQGPEQIGQRHHRHGVLQQEKAGQIEPLTSAETVGAEGGPIVEEALQPAFGPALTLPPQGRQGEHGLLAHLGEMPDRRSGPDTGGGGDVGGIDDADVGRIGHEGALSTRGMREHAPNQGTRF